MSKKPVFINVKWSESTLEELHEFQDDLKELLQEDYEKLRDQILENGFLSPFSIWVDKENVKHILDGHTRRKTLFRMKAEGYEIPSKYPTLIIEAKSMNQAKKILLSLVSQYGQINPEGLQRYLIKAKIDVKNLPKFKLPMMSLNVPSFAEQFFKMPPPPVLAGGDKRQEPLAASSEESAQAWADAAAVPGSPLPDAPVERTEDEKKAAFDQTQEKVEIPNKKFVIIIDCPSDDAKIAFKKRLRDGLLEEFGAKIF